MKVGAPDAMGSSMYMDKKPGFYHFLVTNIIYGKKFNDERYDGLSVELEARAGTDPTQVGKKVSLTLLDPSDDHKDKGHMARCKQFAFLVATNLALPGQMGQTFDIDEQQAMGAQLCAELDVTTGKDGKQYMDVKFSNFYHVDDPRAADIPKATEELTVIPQQFRHAGDTAFFEPLQSRKQQSTGPAPRVNENDFSSVL